jgi:hypothetical protein
MKLCTWYFVRNFACTQKIKMEKTRNSKFISYSFYGQYLSLKVVMFFLRWVWYRCVIN